MSDATKSAHPDVEWRPPTQLRNRIVHGYWDIDLDILVSTIRENLPQLITDLRLLRAEQQQDAGS